MTKINLIEAKPPPPLSASKWLKCQVLLEKDELSDLFDAIGTCYLYHTGRLVNAGEEEISHQDFIGHYEQYLMSLKEGVLPQETDFTALMTVGLDALYAIAVQGDKRLVRNSKPVIQIQSHRIGYSTDDGKFRPMVLGMDSIFWGVQFSYPQICEDPITKEILNVNDQKQFPNTTLFREIQRWMRRNTIPTPFEVDGNRQNVPMRIGKQCLSWVNQHPQLKQFHIHVSTKDDEH